MLGCQDEGSAIIFQPPEMSLLNMGCFIRAEVPECGESTNGLGNTSNQQGCGGTGRGPCRLVFKEDERYLPVSLCQALCESLSTVFIVNSTSLDVFSMFYR